MRTPRICYARNGEVSLAYQVLGEGQVDLLFVPGFASNLIWNWELPSYARFLRTLASFARLIVVDRRGSGLSDRLSPADQPALEVLADDVGVVLDAVGSEQAALFGTQDGGLICSMYAATRPERVHRLILYTVDPGVETWEKAWTSEQANEYLKRAIEGWGTEEYARWHLGPRAPSVADDPRTLEWYSASIALASSPGSAVALLRIYFETDARSVLASIRVPTLLLHRTHDSHETVEESRFVSRLIPGAQLVELPGEDHHWFVGDTDSIAGAVQEFVTGARHTLDQDRVLATVLFTDIVGSTEKAAALGDYAWRELIGAHHEKVRRELEIFRGVEIDTAGDGFLATFDGPARAVRCAAAIGEAVRDLGLEIRAGCHTGEVELTADGVGGIAVHIGARVAALAGPSEVLVSSTVKDLVAGSGLTFEDAGEHELKGVPDRWRLYRVMG